MVNPIARQKYKEVERYIENLSRIEISNLGVDVYIYVSSPCEKIHLSIAGPESYVDSVKVERYGFGDILKISKMEGFDFSVFRSMAISPEGNYYKRGVVTLEIPVLIPIDIKGVVGNIFIK